MEIIWDLRKRVKQTGYLKSVCMLSGSLWGCGFIVRKIPV
ncbi:hypothetical protein HMPREF9371_0661 [Neisseria shayeganii 871]|uniref:Uncharacterized protein n=1 Tax=Neisseria shayeganii 871 TaxID=1032488 RepID=G4CGC2_9NEIS|nr:hypothetical protein HMPREF9371_0661 [Neisseria shayeganii 871]